MVAASLEGATSRLIVRDDKEFGESLPLPFALHVLPDADCFPPSLAADIEVVLLGENYVNIKQRTIVTFTCDPQAPEVRPMGSRSSSSQFHMLTLALCSCQPSDPTFTRSRDGDHYFSWITKLGCLDVAKTGIKKPSDGGQGEEQPPSHAPSPEQGETLKTVQRESRVVLWYVTHLHVACAIYSDALSLPRSCCQVKRRFQRPLLHRASHRPQSSPIFQRNSAISLDRSLPTLALLAVDFKVVVGALLCRPRRR